MTKLDKFKTTCHKYLIIKDDSYIDIIFGAVFANRLDSKPVWLYLVGPPGSGKTEILQAVSTSPECIARSTVTRPSLISGYIKQTKKTKARDPSLIPKLNGKNLIIKDFTTMLKMRREDLMEAIGLLRDAYDGSCSWGFGTFTRTYESKFGVIASVTGVIDQHRGMLAALGERFLTYRMPKITDCEKAQRSRRAMSSCSTTEQEKSLADAAVKVLAADPPIPVLDKNAISKISKIAQIVAKARTEVLRDRFTREPEIPQPEIATRLSKQLGDLAIGLAMVREKTSVGREEIRLIEKTAIHSITLKRNELFETLLSHWPKWTQASEIASEMGFSENAVIRWFQDLFLLKLMEKRTVLTGKMMSRTQQWRLKEGRMLKNILLNNSSI